MNFLNSLMLGILQGLTEFLPVSSSGHLVVLRLFMQVEEIPLLYDVLLHLATLVVVVVVFRRRIGSIFSSLFRAVFKRGNADPEDLRLALIILLATIVTGVIGVGLSRVETVFAGKAAFVGAFFLVTAVVLMLTRISSGERGYMELPLVAALIIGAAQGIAVLPGISRAGITIAAALFCGLKREKAGELAFLVSIPAILGALLLTFSQADSLLAQVALPVLLIGVLASFAAGLAAILLLLRIVRRGRLYLFSIYLIPLSIVTLILLT